MLVICKELKRWSAGKNAKIVDVDWIELSFQTSICLQLKVAESEQVLTLKTRAQHTSDIGTRVRSAPATPLSIVQEHENKLKVIVTMMKLMEFSQENCKIQLAKILVIDDFVNESKPRFKIPSRRTIARNCMQLFIQEKVKLKSKLFLNHQMVSNNPRLNFNSKHELYVYQCSFYWHGWMIKKILNFGDC
ncbi:hypothetical protein CR513_27505, partial [Mucuna pruriens]